MFYEPVITVYFPFSSFLNGSFSNILYFVYPPLLIRSIEADNFSLKIGCQSVEIHTFDDECPTSLGRTEPGL